MSVVFGIAQPCRAPSPRAQADHSEQHGGHDHPADGREDRKDRTAGFTEGTGDEFAFEFQAGDEEDIASSPSATHSPNVRSRCRALGPIVRSCNR